MCTKKLSCLEKCLFETSAFISGQRTRARNSSIGGFNCWTWFSELESPILSRISRPISYSIFCTRQLSDARAGLSNGKIDKRVVNFQNYYHFFKIRHKLSVEFSSFFFNGRNSRTIQWETGSQKITLETENFSRDSLFAFYNNWLKSKIIHKTDILRIGDK